MVTTLGKHHFQDHIGLNFIRPDVNRPGNYDFLHSGEWLVTQYEQLGLRWNRLSFSWVLVQPAFGTYQWEPYDKIVDACQKANINILATLGGHFDNPPVPAWAGESLKAVVNEHPEYLYQFVEAWVNRYHHFIQYWEILNEPSGFHKDLTVAEYSSIILRECSRIIKSIDPHARILPCAYNHLPLVGSHDAFWKVAPEVCDIYNYHQYQHWGYFLTVPSAGADETELYAFRARMEKNGELHKSFWVTETGWWGSCAITGSMFDIYKRFPGKLEMETQPSYSGNEILTHPIVQREDALRAEWMKDIFPRALSIPGCEKIFLWVSLDEFEGGYHPEKRFGSSKADPNARQVDLWGIIAGDKKWRKSAFTLQEILATST